MRQTITGLTEKHSQSNVYLQTYFHKYFHNRVSLPVLIDSHMFLLDFQKSYALHKKWLKTQSDERLNQMLQLVVSAYGKMSTTALVDKMIELGAAPKTAPGTDIPDEGALRAKLEDMIDFIQKKIIENSVQGGLQNLIVRDALTQSLSEAELNDLGKTNLSSISGVVSDVHDFYAAFVNEESGQELAQRLTAYHSANPLLGAIRALVKTCRLETGAVIMVRESYALEQLYKIAFERPLIKVEDLIPSRAYDVKSIDIPELSFSNTLAAYQWCLQVITGALPSGDEASATYKISDVIDRIVTGLGRQPLGQPVEAGSVDFSVMEKAFVRVYLIHVILRVLRDSPGDFRSSVNNQIERNKFFKLEEYQKEFKASLYSISVAFEAFRDTAAFFSVMAKSEDLWYGSGDGAIHPVVRRKILAFMEDQYKAETFSLSQDNPNFYKQAQIVMSASLSDLYSDPKTPSYTYPRKKILATTPFMDFSGSERWIRIFSAGIAQMDWRDLGTEALPYPIRFMRHITVLKPTYYMSVPVQDTLLTKDVIKQKYRFMSFNDFAKLRAKHPEAADFIQSQSVLEYIGSPEQLSREMELPLELARSIWGAGSDEKIFVNMTHNESLIFFFSPDLVPTYEIKELSSQEFVLPFVGHYPLLDVEAEESFDFERSPAKRDKGLGGDDPKGKGKNKPASGKEKDKSAEDGGKTDEEDDDEGETK